MRFMAMKRPVDYFRRALLMYAIVCGIATAGIVAFWPEQAPGFALAAGVGFLAAWIVGDLCHRSVRRHVQDLRRATDAITRGDLTRKPGRSGTQGLVKLAGSLDRLADQFRATLEEEQTLRHQLTRSESLALIGELAATVAHEVNNPLDGLQDAVTILKRHEQITDESRELLHMMEDGLYRIEMIVRRLLTMSRDEPMQPADVAIREIVNDARLFAQPRFNRRGIEFVCDCLDDSPTVHADRRHLSQVLINLMLNAADAMPEGGTLVLKTREDQGRVIVELTDNGSGIQPENMDAVFEPFFTTKSGGKGTGLGLTVAKRVVEAHQGHITAESEPGKGTRFRIELPGATRTRGKPDAASEIPQSSRRSAPRIL